MRRGKTAVLAITLLAASVPAISSFRPWQPAASTAASDGENVDGAAKALARVGPRFEPNRGQADPRVRFLSRGPGYTLFITPTETVFNLAVPADGDEGVGNAEVVRIRLDGANPSSELQGGDLRGAVSNYLLGNDSSQWVSGVPTYARVTHADVYPGVDLVYYGDDQGQLEYDFVVAPGVDPDAIALSFQGQESLAVDGLGDLVISTKAGDLRHKRPVIYQESDGGRNAVPGGYAIDGTRVRFTLGHYDATLPLVIDPVVSYSTYLGGNLDDEATGIAVDKQGSAYVTGRTCSANFPVSPEDRTVPPRPEGQGCNAFVTKLTPDGSDVVYSTYLGGTPPDKPPAPPPGTEYRYPNMGADVGTSIAVDGEGSAYVTGYTYAHNFPTTDNAYSQGCGLRPKNSSCDTHIERYSNPNPFFLRSFLVTVRYVPDAFVAKLNADGSSLAYSTYLGGRASEGANPETNRPPSSADLPAHFSGEDVARGIAVDSLGNAYVSGSTTSEHFPTRNAADDRCGTTSDGRCNGFYQPDAFVTKLNPNSAKDASLVYSSFLGGSGKDAANGLALRPQGSQVYVGGIASAGFPVNDGAIEQELGTAFVARLDTEATGASSLTSATYLGGGPGSWTLDVVGVTSDAAGDPYLTGFTNGAADQLPAGTPVSTLGPGESGGYVAKLNADLSAWRQVTFIPRAKPSAIIADPDGHAHITGSTEWTDFPTVNAFQGANAQHCSTLNTRCTFPDAFVAKLTSDGSGFVHASYLGGGHDQPSLGRAIALGPGHDVFVAGETRSKSFPRSSDAFSGPAGGVDGFATRISSLPLPRVSALGPDRGPTSGGTAVTITGAGFRGATSVKFGSEPAPFTAHPDDPATEVDEADTTITATSPAQDEASALVTVANSSGTSPPVAPFATFIYEEGTVIGTGLTLLGAGYTTTLLDHRDCRKPPASRPLGFDYPCGKVLLVGSTVRLYDPSAGPAGTWSTSHCSPVGPVCPGQLKTPRTWHTASLLRDGRVLVAGGENSNRSLNSVEIYQPTTGTWANGGDLVLWRRNHTATLLHRAECDGATPPPGYPCGKVLLAGGLGAIPLRNSDADATETAELYDPMADNATGKSALTSPMSHAGPCLVSDVDEAGGCGRGRGYHSATLLEGSRCGAKCGKVLVVGGVTNVVELYDPTTSPTGTWATEPSTVFPHSRPTATLLRSGKVLVVGGAGGEAEVYDPAAEDPDQVWSWAGRLSQSRNSGNGAALLPNGKVLIVGGSNDAGSERSELYEPDAGSGRWRFATPTLRLYWRGTTATLLSSRADRFEADPNACGRLCGKVLVVAQAGAELYTPAPSVTKVTPDSGRAAGGDSATITGTGLPDGRVFFDKEEATVTRSSYGEVEVTVPAMADNARPGITVLGEGGPVRAPGGTLFRYLGPPGGVGRLAVDFPDEGNAVLRFAAAGSVHDAHPPATRYVVKQSREPITEANFGTARALCDGGICDDFTPRRVGQELSLHVGRLSPGVRYHWAVRALSEQGELGPMSVVDALAPGTAATDSTVPEAPVEPRLAEEGCATPKTPSTTDITYPAGYSLVGVPGGTVIGAQSPLWRWLDQGAGGDYGIATSPADGEGYWAWFSCPSVVTLTAGTPGVTMPLGAYRASMVGNPSGVTAAVVSGHDFVARWDPALNAGAGGYHISGYRQSQSMAVGEGVWVFSYVPTEVRIEAGG